jgi:hypothetical protein
MTSYYCDKCKAEFGLGVECNCKPQFDPEALDASMRIGNHHILFGKIPSGPGMAEIITACYGPTLAKSKASRHSLVASCLRMAGNNTLLRHQRDAYADLAQRAVRLLEMPKQPWYIRLWDRMAGTEQLLEENEHLDWRNEELENEVAMYKTAFDGLSFHYDQLLKKHVQGITQP